MLGKITIFSCGMRLGHGGMQGTTLRPKQNCGSALPTSASEEIKQAPTKCAQALWVVKVHNAGSKSAADRQHMPCKENTILTEILTKMSGKHGGRLTSGHKNETAKGTFSYTAES